MFIVITGVPGCGKSITAKILSAKFRFSPAGPIEVLHISEFAKAKKLFSGSDKKMKSNIVDLKKLETELKKECAKKKNLIVEGHTACEIRFDADYVFVLRCNPKELEKRLKKRKYSREKIDENMLAEMLDYCTQKTESTYAKEKIFEIETANKSAEQTTTRMYKIISRVRDKPKKVGISYAKELKEFLGLKKHGT